MFRPVKQPNNLIAIWDDRKLLLESYNLDKGKAIDKLSILCSNGIKNASLNPEVRKTVEKIIENILYCSFDNKVFSDMIEKCDIIADIINTMKQ